MTDFATDHASLLYGGIEAGGTKFVCAISDGNGPELLARIELPTLADPERLMTQVCEWFEQQSLTHGPLHAIGVASFGPLDLRADSPTYGFITTTPKPGWKYANLLGPLRSHFPDAVLAIDTDVNGAAFGEFQWGVGRGLTDFIYLTMGTGIGGGGLSGGSLLHGLVHPEFGHMRVSRLPGDEFSGVCPYHGDCWEGLCSGPALLARTGVAGDQLPADHPAWQIQAWYTAQALVNVVCLLSPQRIAIGGSVSQGGQLGASRFFEMVRKNVQDLLAGYVASPMLSNEQIASYIVPPKLGSNAGICGAIALAANATHVAAGEVTAL